MSWWNKNKKLGISILAGLLIFAAGIVFVPIVVGPFAGCTFVGCRGGIDIELTGLPASSPYQIDFILPSGETQSITCDANTRKGPDTLGGSGCKVNGAFFGLQQDSGPKEITVTVIISGNEVSQVFRPKYEKFQPNGWNCPPICYSATIKMNLTQ